MYCLALQIFYLHKKQSYNMMLLGPIYPKRKKPSKHPLVKFQFLQIIFTLMNARNILQEALQHVDLRST